MFVGVDVREKDRWNDGDSIFRKDDASFRINVIFRNTVAIFRINVAILFVDNVMLFLVTWRAHLLTLSLKRDGSYSKRTKMMIQE